MWFAKQDCRSRLQIESAKFYMRTGHIYFSLVMAFFTFYV